VKTIGAYKLTLVLKFYKTITVVCTNVDQDLIADQHNFRVKYLQNGEEN